MSNILDLMTEQERENVKKRCQNRIKRRRDFESDRVSPEIYLVAELGYYLGYEAIRDVRNNVIDLDEMFALLEGCRKVWYSKLVETSRGSMIAFGVSMSKQPVESFDESIKPYSKRAKIKE